MKAKGQTKRGTKAARTIIYALIGSALLAGVVLVPIYRANLAAQALTTANSVSTRVLINPDGTVSVSFQGQPGASYQIYYSDSLATAPGKTPWTLAADNLVATNGWTVWVDAGDATRPRPSQARQRFYRVTLKSPSAVNLTPDPVPPTLARSALSQSEELTDLQEAADGGRLLNALAAGDNQLVLDILRQHGIAETTLAAMSSRLGQTPAHVSLAEPFLKAVEAMSLAGDPTDVQARFQTAMALGYGRPFWVAQSLAAGWPDRCDEELSRCPLPPIGVLNMSLQEVDVIEFFKWYDRYAERLHSVVLNGDLLNNFDLKEGYADANLLISGLYKLIKARKPDAFAWVRVVWLDDDSDVAWLQALSFRSDGLVLWNLHSFRSPFGKARTKYLPIVGEQTAMIVSEFYGYWPQVAELGDLRDIGQIVAPLVGEEEEHLQALGYRGLAPNWLLLKAVTEARQ